MRGVSFGKGIAAVLLACTLLLSCSRTEGPAGEGGSVPQTDTVQVTEPVPAAPEADTEAVETEAPETESPETEPPETEPPETEPPETESPETDPPETDPDEDMPESEELLTAPEAEITGWSDEEEGKEELPSPEKEPDPEPEKPAEPEKPVEPEKQPERIYNYLNGKSCTLEEQKRRPVAIMLNNLKKQLPQYGLSYGQVFYECAAEGGITRIMMLVDDYEKMGTVGSIRSARDYFVDFLANHDALYVHAGGSGTAYSKISWRGIENMDGVNMYLPSTFWRDQNRMVNIGYEHSLMTNGEGIVSGIQYKGYRTELDENQKPLFLFYGENENRSIYGSPATHVHMPVTFANTVDFVYDKDRGEYLRYQYDGMPHVDGANGEQIAVKNLLILFTDIDVIPGDAAGRLTVGTVGQGQGYYVTNGRRRVIAWSRAGKTDCLELTYKNGKELRLNCGKTFICVVDRDVAPLIDFEYRW